MDDMHQLIQRLDWMDKERQKDRQEMARLTERLNALENEKAGLENRLKQIDADIARATASAARVTSIDPMLDQMRADVSKQIDQLESRRADSEREQERLRLIEREGTSRALSELRKQVEPIPRVEQDLIARKEEERRVGKLLSDIQGKATDVMRRDDERVRAMAALEEARRLDARRVVDMQAELPELRKRIDENRAKLEILEDMVRRNDVRIGEVVALENDRRLTQMAWMETQQVATAERDRAWNDLRQRAETILRDTGDFGHRMDTYAETHRQMKKALEDYYVHLERIDRRVNEANEIQRLGEERFKQEWNAFLADEQKRWTTHMLLRDEQWRENDRLISKVAERLDGLEDQIPDVRETLRGLQAIDQARLQGFYTLLREWMAEYDQALTKVR